MTCEKNTETTEHEHVLPFAMSISKLKSGEDGEPAEFALCVHRRLLQQRQTSDHCTSVVDLKTVLQRSLAGSSTREGHGREGSSPIG